MVRSIASQGFVWVDGALAESGARIDGTLAEFENMIDEKLARGPGSYSPRESYSEAVPFSSGFDKTPSKQKRTAQKKTVSPAQKTYSVEELVGSYAREFEQIAASDAYTRNGIEVMSRRLLGGYVAMLNNSGLSEAKKKLASARLEETRQGVICNHVTKSFYGLISQFQENGLHPGREAAEAFGIFKEEVIPVYSLSEPNRAAVLKTIARGVASQIVYGPTIALAGP